VQVFGVGLILGGIALLVWFFATQGATTSFRRARRRVSFDHSLELTVPATRMRDPSRFVLARDDRTIGRRLLGVLWLLVLIAVVAAAVAGGLWGLGRLIVRAISGYFSGA
jgi:hypothetical protein